MNFKRWADLEDEDDEGMDFVHFGVSKEVNAVKFENDALPYTFSTEDNYRQFSDCISSETTCVFSDELDVDAILFG